MSLSAPQQTALERRAHLLTITTESLSEAGFQAAVIAEAKSSGWWIFHTHDSRRSEPGLPDILAIRGEHKFWAELKTNTGRLTEEQKRVAALLLNAGDPIYIWRPRDWLEILQVLA